MGDRIRIKGDTAENLTSGNPLLHPREMCVETDTGRWKFGTGSTPQNWNDLPYNDSVPDHEIDGATIRFRNPDGTWGDWVDIRNGFQDLSFVDNLDGTISLTFVFASGDPQTVTMDSSVLRDEITGVTAEDQGSGVVKITFSYTYSADRVIYTPDLTGPPSVKIWYDADGESHPTPLDPGELKYDAVWKKLYIGDASTPTEWEEIEIGAGATGGGLDQVFIQNDQTITTNYSIPAGKNAMSTGPVEIEAGVTVTIPSGSRWVIV